MTLFDPHFTPQSSRFLSDERKVLVDADEFYRLLREFAELHTIFHRVKSEPRQMRQTIRYYGGKWKIAKWILSFFPPHKVYLEPCFGSGAIYFSKKPSKVEVISDLNSDVVHFFKMLRNRPDDLIRSIAFTPYAESEYYTAFETSSSDDIERARLFYIRSDMGWNGAGERSSGFRRERRSTRDVSVTVEFKAIQHLYMAAARLQDAQIDRIDVFEQIPRYDDPETLVYLDLPYVYDTRGAGKKIYRHEMSDEDHRRIADLVKSSKSMFLISGYASPLYDELYAGWRCESHSTLDVNSNPQTEMLWISPNVPLMKQMPLFE